MPFNRGDVVALRRSGVGIVWASKDGDVWIIPVTGANGPPRHRAEVRIEDLADIASCGFSLRYPVARCHGLQRWKLAKLPSQEAIGKAPVALVARIVTAITREAAAQSQEARFHFLDAGARLSSRYA